MAMAKQCDRCGSFYKDNTYLSIGGIFVTQIRFGSSRGDIKAYDFCDECLSNFENNFMKKIDWDIPKESIQSNTKRKVISIRHRLGEYEGFKPLDEYGKCKHLCYEDDYMQVYCDSEECDKCK